MKTSISEMIKVMEAYANGKQVQVKLLSDWEDIPRPSWNWGDFDYRIASEREIDWTKVPKDTKVFVWDDGCHSGINAHFCNYHDGKFFVYAHGATSWTSHCVVGYDHCELAEPAKEEWYK